MQLNILIDACHFQSFPKDTVLDLINGFHDLHFGIAEADTVVKPTVNQNRTIPVNSRGNKKSPIYRII
jgi:hypothetical protein